MKNLKKRALLATAAAGKLAAGSFQANAGIVYENPDDITVHLNLPLISAVRIDIDGDSDIDLSFTHQMEENSDNPGIWEGNSTVWGVPWGTTFDFFDEGDEISSTNSEVLQFASASKRLEDDFSKSQATDGLFESGGAGFLGFTLESGNKGWLSFNVADFTGTDDTSYSLTINDWAYEDSGKSIKAGEVPEPAVWSLFALGAYYIARRRNKNA